MREKIIENRSKNNNFFKESQECKISFKPKERKIVCFICGDEHFVQICPKKIVKSNSKKEFTYIFREYEFNKVPFRLSTSPITFQWYINNIFKEFLKDGTLIIYLDDIIIPASNEEEALKK